MANKRFKTLYRATFIFLFGVLAVFGTDAQEPAAVPAADAHTIVTVLPKGNENVPRIQASNLNVKVDGKAAAVSSLTHFDHTQNNLQLLLLIDDSARSSLGLYLKEMSSFLTSLPPNVLVGVAYIQNGGVHFVQPFTPDHAAAASTLHAPASPSGANADPYFALTDLAKRWPSAAPGFRHEVVMISNGVSSYSGLRYDPDNPYVTNATSQAQKAGIVVYSIYYKDRGFAQRLGAAINSGQNYLIQMSEATGGELYYEGFENPVSMAPFFSQISRNLENQYELSLAVPTRVKDGLQSLKVKLNAPNAKLNSASDVFIGETLEKAAVR